MTKAINKAATFCVYESRVASHPDLAELDGVYLSTFDLYSTLECDDDGNLDVPANIPDCLAFHLVAVARSRGYHVRGVTSERKVNGEYICRDLGGKPRERCEVVYVGPHNHFTGHIQSKWYLTTVDRVHQGAQFVLNDDV